MGVTSVKGDDAMTYLDDSRPTFYFRRVVPKELRPYFLTATGKPRTEFMVSLRTKDRPTAKERCNLEAVKTDRLLSEARARLQAGLAPEPGATPAPRPPPRRVEPFRSQDEQEGLAQDEAYWREQDARIEADPVQRQISDAVSAAMLQRDRENAALWAEAQAEERSAKPVTKGTRLAVLVDMWANEKSPQLKTVERMVQVSQWFQRITGRDTVEAITPQDVMDFKDRLLAEKTEANTRTKLANLNTLLTYAHTTRRLIKENPAAGIRITVKAKPGRSRREFDQTALSALFGSPVYTDGFRPDGGAGEAAYWLPLLGLYTGARLNELGQLRPRDIYKETYDEDGRDAEAWVIRITADEDDGLKLKNVGSERRVPIHSDLVSLGFLDFVAASTGQPRLFPALKPDRFGTVTAAWSRWFNRYLDLTCKVTDKRVVFHSFRHSFKHYARQSSLPKEDHDTITGHRTGDSGDGYGGLSHPLERLVTAMARYRVPGFKLPAPPPSLKAPDTSLSRA